MSDLLAIVKETIDNEALMEEIVRRRPDRVTILLEDESAGADWAIDESQRASALRDRLTSLLTAIEQRTGAVVVGLAGSRDQLVGWRFDRTIGGSESLPV